jgi:sulfide:quinone oxidoreductase
MCVGPGDVKIEVMISRSSNPLRVVIAGAGVAGLEAMLALRQLGGELVDIEILSPASQFVYRPMLVAEPFGTAQALRLDLAPIVAGAGARHRGEALAGVDLAERTIATGSGARVEFDALLIALGARPSAAVPGAITFDPTSDNSDLDRVLVTLGRRHLRRLAFVVPRQPSWTLAAYELALMTAAERDVRRIPGLEICLVTAERAPLGLFGVEASRIVAETLERRGIGLVTSARVERYAGGELELGNGARSLQVDAAVALPALTVPELPGLPQRSGGFVVTDVSMHVGGLDRVWAAGDVTDFPVKHGGLAAQQADVAARAIAALAGADVAFEPFRPVLQGALITGGSPDFLQAPVADPAAGTASIGRPLWTPSIKLAARYLGPHLSRALRGGGIAPGFVDLDPEEIASDARSHEHAIEAAVTAADADAARGDYESALKWMSLVEQLDLALPATLVARRERWRAELDPGAVAHRAAGRIDPSFATPDQAISDLRRRAGWLREAETRGSDEMEAQLVRLDRGIDALVQLSRRVGTLPS